jgi:hypothetical protein
VVTIAVVLLLVATPAAVLLLVRRWRRPGRTGRRLRTQAPAGPV